MNRKSQIYTDVDLDTFQLEIPNFQRSLNQEHVDEIFKTTIEYVKLEAGTPFPILSIARYQEGLTYKFFIIDGQHRYHAYKKIYQLGYKFLVDIQVVNCVDANEALHLYKLSNKRMEHSETQLNDETSQLEKDIIIWMNEKEQSKFFGYNMSPRPKIRIQTFIDKFHNSSIKSKIYNLDDFRIYLTNKNEEIKQTFLRDIYYFRCQYDLTESMIKKAIDLNFFLGLDKNLAWLN